MIRSLLAALALAGAVPAQAACLTNAEAESLTLVAMPDLIRQTGAACAQRLPAGSLLRRSNTPFFQRYDAEANRAWPAAQAALAKLSDPAIEPLLQSQFARPLLSTMLVPMVLGTIDPADCGTIDRLATLLEPLPPRNTAGIVVTTLQYLKAEKAKAKRGAIVQDIPDLPLCAAQR
ncbi:hypothetical protein [Sphingomonas aracearum]|uniref:Uncharacterized protein n=1 Tax=Sphingomonas aracearum TaxID=2283317 RepID=A0A369VUX0_9SPHN|nr:hypothetical protein [Sphingomonas aracearum]RDE06176.1 hypothetical protein DVW87_00050 [Sphingomonas aracearum]